MKNKINLFGIIALLALIVFTMTACNRGGEGGGGIRSILGGGGGGTFTLTGIPSKYNGQYAWFQCGHGDYDEVVLSWEKKGTLDKNSRISNGRVTLPLWTGTDDLVRYSGNHTMQVFVHIQSSSYSMIPSSTLMFSNERIKFTNGSATRAWKDAEGHVNTVTGTPIVD